VQAALDRQQQHAGGDGEDANIIDIEDLVAVHGADQYGLRALIGREALAD
jgi:hypothetical protein